MTEHNNPAGPAANKDTLRAELANALHEDWCGCDSWDGVNCEDYHEGEFPESADAALAVVVPVLERQAVEIADHWRAAHADEGTKAELAEENISLRAEVARLAAIATAAEYHTGPEECCDSECDHLYDDEGNFTGSDDDWCPHVEMRHAMAEDAIEAHKVPLLVSAIERLTREQDEAQAKLEQSHEINEGWVRYGERVKQQKREWRQRVSEHRNLLGAIWLHVPWRSITRQLTTEVQPGDKIGFAEERNGYTVQAVSTDGRWAVCTKEFAACDTVIYTVIDFQDGGRRQLPRWPRRLRRLCRFVWTAG